MIPGVVVTEDITTGILLVSTTGKAMTKDCILMNDTCRKWNMIATHTKNGKPEAGTMQTGIKTGSINEEFFATNCTNYA